MFRSFHRPNEMTDDAATQPALIPERANALASSGTSSAASMPNTSAFEIIDHKPTYSHDNDDAAEPEEQDDAKPAASSPTLSVLPDTLSESILDDLPVSPSVSVASDGNDITTQHDSNNSKKRKPNTQHPDLKPPPKLSMTLHEPPQQVVVETVPVDGNDSDSMTLLEPPQQHVVETVPNDGNDANEHIRKIFALRLDDNEAEEPRPDATVPDLIPENTVQMPVEVPVGTPETAANNHPVNVVREDPPEPPAGVDLPELPARLSKFWVIGAAVGAVLVIWFLSTVVFPSEDGGSGFTVETNTPENSGAPKAAPSGVAVPSTAISLFSAVVPVGTGPTGLPSNNTEIETDNFPLSSDENDIGDAPTHDLLEDKQDPPSPELSFWSKVKESIGLGWTGLTSTVKGFNESKWAGHSGAAVMVILGCLYALHAVFTSFKQSCFEEDEVKQGGLAIWSGKREQGLPRGFSVGVEELCNFLRNCNQSFSRKGRHSRAVPPSCPGLAYNTSAYEVLTVEELRDVGNFLGVSLLRASDVKAMLIGKIVPAYEALLTGFVISEIKEVLKIKNVSPSWKDKKGDLVKLAVEAGF